MTSPFLFPESVNSTIDTLTIADAPESDESAVTALSAYPNAMTAGIAAIAATNARRPISGAF